MKLKESGIAWMGKIPEHWEVRKIKYIFCETSIKNCGNKQQLASTQQYGVIPKFLYPSRVVEVVLSDLNSFKLVEKDDFVISLRSFEGGIEHSQYEGIISPAYTVLKARNSVKSLYFKFLLKSSSFISALQLYKIGIREGQNISYTELQQDFLPLPPLEEQQAIADFLDRKCNQIEEWITKKEKLISLLEEKKQALISQAVTKGLNKNAKLKESGIEWLGQIPEHWEVMRLANLGVFKKGGNISRQNLTSEGEFAILYGDIYTKYEIKTYFLESRIPQDISLSATPIYKGDILFAGSGETKEDIGKNIVYLGDKRAFAGGDIIIFRQHKEDSLFLSYALNTQYAKAYKNIESKGEIIVHIYASNLRELKIPLPPLEEQKTIAQYLDTQIEKIDLAISKIRSQIKLIKEYKTTLISESVCGRIER